MVSIGDLAAKESDVLPKGMTPKKLLKSVTRKYAYINKRLMSESVLEKIKASGNQKAISNISEAQQVRDRIAIQINNKEYKNAYFELKRLNSLMSKALKLSRSGERKIKQLKNDMESAKIVNDTYIARARKRDISVNSGSEAFTIYKEAMKRRVEASKQKKAKKYKAATTSYKESTRLLKESIKKAKKPA
ncbi:MAG: hypothetical protein L3J28_00270 [Candidatus Polarisedimenticolaceae bacterium]|nr:hypothetical protein [Candidatus Polarisedimenticolaceae bacterium]